MFSKSFRLELEQRKAAGMAFEKWGGGEGLCLHSQEGQDLCACAEIFAMVAQYMEDKRPHL